ncbi:alpha/beta hydrolase [Saccharicrinis fermentans]|uniref:Alpha/beta hydrolase fold protein n=1 Tax=Saccharicrinis fermentans DSM 9555 = JCM 21142 TaxID=869213 RepID=W7Y4C8_9BACT|nr:alpha/beta hydrolase [Saccharicrinis fermentans]GAF02438.1 alpha/beta hydrolase fold protein [Saccharicrinis fermentans DSM 9555 = JCM 21142]
MKHIYLTLIVLLIFTSLMGQERDTIRLWSGEVPNEPLPKGAAVVSDNDKGNVLRLSQITDPAMVIFEPEMANGSGAGIIVCPGGGYSILAVDKEGYEIAEWLNKLGYTAFVLQYRIPKKREAALIDIQRAIRVVRSKVDIYGLHADRIGVMGFSAGGSLCARASTHFSVDTYAKSEALDSLSCRPDFSLLIYPAYLDEGLNNSLSPELDITEQTPPFFIFGTADDRYGNSPLVFTKALRDHQIPVDLHIISKGGHGYGLRPGNVAAQTWPALAEKWLSRTIR